MSLLTREKPKGAPPPPVRPGLLPVFVQNPTGVNTMGKMPSSFPDSPLSPINHEISGFPSNYKPEIPPHTPRQECSGNFRSYFLGPGLMLRLLPSRIPTIEQVDDVYYKSASTCMVVLGFAILYEVFLLTAMVTPFYDNNISSSVGAFMQETAAAWIWLAASELGYHIVLVILAVVAYRRTVRSGRQWTNVYYIAVAGMLLEIVFIAIVKGIIALYASTLAGLSNCAHEMRLLGQVLWLP
ncbi:hypothetical protein TGME49_203070 [Toxoplasma gondii ME49]|uniref:Transmembrane protein n=1 Tax=Toxoplasma gondii (strain ATCC 50611 / Me49) TaxID=508771 RepID=S8GE93_TOXGM|nr:hypothetical protein TGME49_203070 [Toxoplasma gondii ME49]EPT30160.1 hypothetical protein TGME49_203070 [Toxoplasma gondii ME49]|eukprot:XP_018637372.1 hypothetical protein TGME49_203070 [Toxoplasma gondii ME49]